MNKYKILIAILTSGCFVVSCAKNNTFFTWELLKNGQIFLENKTSLDNPAESGKEKISGEMVGRLIIDYQSLFERHPDFDLAEAKDRWQAFKALNPLAQTREYSRFHEEYTALESELMHKVLQLTEENLSAPDMLNYKTFTPNGFKDFYDSIHYEQLEEIPVPPYITGDEQIDEHIRTLAERRGYRLRPKTEADKLSVVEGIYLQPEAIAAYRQLKKAALEHGLKLGILSGFRSIEAQRVFFLKVFEQTAVRRLGRAYTKQEILAGEADAVLNWILETTSIPGYSKHHSGYALDFIEVGSKKHFVEFALTKIHPWLAAHNFYNAKRFGFIPSYPEGATAQGPLPEAWEYVWVGLEALKR